VGTFANGVQLVQTEALPSYAIMSPWHTTEQTSWYAMVGKKCHSDHGPNMAVQHIASSF
jgi:hypothetical protein